jgi:diacylglycerol kinase (ATP)
MHVLINPQAAGGRAARMEQPLRQWLRQHCDHARLHTARSVQDGLDWLSTLPEASRVVLVGGDGTINQMLPGLLEYRHTLAVLPRGSGNDCARALGVYRMDWQDCLRLAMQGTPGAMDVGWLHSTAIQRPFLSSLTIGFDSAVCYRALHGPRWLRGLPRYLLATLRELHALQTWDMRVALDGTEVQHGTSLFASCLNTPTYGSGMPAVPQARTDDGRLDALIAGGFSALQALAMLPQLLVGRHLGHPRIRCQPFQTLQVQSPTPLPVATDGEYVGEFADVRVRVAAGALAVLSA